MIADLLTDQMDISILTDNSRKDNSAAPVQVYTVTATNIPCQITPVSTSQFITAAMSGMAISHKILTLYSGLKQGDRIIDVSDGSIIRVVGIQRISARGGVIEHYIITGEEIRDGSPST